MGKIFYSALVNTIRGKVSHSVLSAWKGINVIKRHTSGVRQPRTEKQQDIRGMLSELAGEWYSLTQVQKDLWNSWCAMYSLPMTGLNAYAKFNQVLQKYFPGMAKKTEPPATPATPDFPTGFTVTPIASGAFCVIWTTPTATTIHVIADYWPMPGRDSVSNPRWTFGASAGSDATFADLTLTMPENVVVKFRIRTLDEEGRVSPWSHVLVTAASA